MMIIQIGDYMNITKQQHKWFTGFLFDCMCVFTFIWSMSFIFLSLNGIDTFIWFIGFMRIISVFGVFSGIPVYMIYYFMVMYGGFITIKILSNKSFWGL